MVSLFQRDLTASKETSSPLAAHHSTFYSHFTGVFVVSFSSDYLPACLSPPSPGHTPHTITRRATTVRRARPQSANTPCLAHPAVSKHRRIRRKGRYPRDTPTPSLATARERRFLLYGCPSVLSRHPLPGPDPEHYHQPILIFVSASPPITRPPFPPP